MHESSPGGESPYDLTVVMMEFAHHADELKNLFTVLSGDPAIKVIVLIPEKISRKIGPDSFLAPNIELILKNDKETVASFLKSHAARIDNADVVYINTIRKHLRDLSRYPFKKPLLVRIHNVHAELDPWRHLNWDRERLFSTLSYVIRRMIFQRKHGFRKKLLKFASGLLLANSEIARYARQSAFLHHEKVLPYTVPLAFMPGEPEPPRDKPREQPVILAITGTINRKRKDYSQVCHALAMVSDHLRRPVELRLLGRPKDSEERAIVERLRESETARFRIRYNKAFVNSKEYQALMKEVDFLVAPIQVHTTSSVFRETYGQSKMSGIENDIITTQKPALVVDTYQLPAELRDVCASYHSTEHLGEMLLEWINESAFLDYGDRFPQLDSYKPERIRSEFRAICREVMEK